MDFREDIIANGKEILGRELTPEEVEKINSEMESKYDSYPEIYDEECDCAALFDEDFYDNLKEIVDELFGEEGDE